MKKLIYPAIISFENNQFVVEFPDLPGCQTWGSDKQEEILDYAVEALSGYIESAIELGQTLPEPTKLQNLKLNPGEYASLVEATIKHDGIPFQIKHKTPKEDLLEAIEDVRLGRNLHGPFATAEEAVRSMLED